MLVLTPSTLMFMSFISFINVRKSNVVTIILQKSHYLKENYFTTYTNLYKELAVVCKFESEKTWQWKQVFT